MASARWMEETEPGDAAIKPPEQPRLQGVATNRSLRSSGVRGVILLCMLESAQCEVVRDIVVWSAKSRGVTAGICTASLQCCSVGLPGTGCNVCCSCNFGMGCPPDGSSGSAVQSTRLLCTGRRFSCSCNFEMMPHSAGLLLVPNCGRAVCADPPVTSAFGTMPRAMCGIAVFSDREVLQGASFEGHGRAASAVVTALEELPEASTLEPAVSSQLAS